MPRWPRGSGRSELQLIPEGPRHQRTTTGSSSVRTARASGHSPSSLKPRPRPLNHHPRHSVPADRLTAALTQLEQRFRGGHDARLVNGGGISDECNPSRLRDTEE